ncbi:hypothetical protein CEP54_016303 [Fusarium duplospermum]|uniref:Uncharacterized protein n=1 Tax=Fusarium duplospermum TaxID=1325734 RepID=A0A428NFI9_9HYPO|nr:hypothetical protein CEP54_016303 [Fusarium duplospermum]
MLLASPNSQTTGSHLTIFTSETDAEPSWPQSLRSPLRLRGINAWPGPQNAATSPNTVSAPASITPQTQDEKDASTVKEEVDHSCGVADPGPFTILKPISHELVLYRRRYRNMSSLQVRSEVRQQLIEGSIGSMSPGEI